MDADRHDDLLDELLGDALAAAGCPDGERLAAFVDRALDEAAANEVAAHLVSCRRCRDDVAAVRAAESAPLSDAARAAMAAAVQGEAAPEPALRIRRLPRWVPGAAAAAALFAISTVALQSQWRAVEPAYVPVTGSGTPVATTHVSFDPVRPTSTPSTPAPAATTASPAPAPATAVVPAPPVPSTHTATPSAPATAAPQPPVTAAPQPPATHAPATAVPAAPTTSTSAPAPVAPAAPTPPEGPGTAPSTPAAPVVAKQVDLRDLQGKLAVRRAGSESFERTRATAIALAPGDMVTPVNGHPVSFGVAPDVTVALQSGARLAVRRVGERLELQLEQGGCAVETLGLPRPITITTPHGDLAGAIARAEVRTARDGMQSAIAEGAAVLACHGESVEVQAGHGVQCGKKGPGRVKRVNARAVSRWAESVMPACDRHGRDGARCPVCIRAQQILEERKARLGGGTKSRNRGGAGESEPEEKPEPAPAPPGGPGAPPPPPPGGGGGMGGPPPPPPPGGPGGPNQPAPNPGEKKEEEKPEAPEPGTKPPTPNTPTQPTKFDLPKHLRDAPLPRCCRHGKGKCWQIVKKYGPSLPWPWPETDKGKEKR